MKRINHRRQHYPKASKYISLYPPSSTADGNEDSGDDGVKKPRIESNEGAAITTAKRQELRESIRLAMNSGQILPQPEIDLANRTGSGDSMPAASLQQGEPSDSKVERSKSKKPRPAPDLKDDPFFEMNVD